MANPLDLAGKKISDTYIRVVQISGNKLYDGVGNQIIDLNQLNENVAIFHAGETVHVGHCLYVGTDGKVYLYKSSDVVNAGNFIGMAATSGAMDTEIQVTLAGLFSDPGIGYTAGIEYFASTTGYLSSTPPTTGFVHQVGVGVDVDIIKISPMMSYTLG